jgi:hypothetical protein
MIGRLINVLVLAMMLATVGWHYRDTEAVQKRRPLIESALSKVGVDVTTVRKYWPLDGLRGKAPTSSAGSAAGAFIDTYNPVTKIRSQLNLADQSQQQRDAGLRQVGQ